MPLSGTYLIVRVSVLHVWEHSAYVLRPAVLQHTAIVAISECELWQAHVPAAVEQTISPPMSSVTLFASLGRGCSAASSPGRASSVASTTAFGGAAGCRFAAAKARNVLACCRCWCAGAVCRSSGIAHHVMSIRCSILLRRGEHVTMRTRVPHPPRRQGAMLMPCHRRHLRDASWWQPSTQRRTRVQVHGGQPVLHPLCGPAVHAAADDPLQSSTSYLRSWP